MKAFGWIVGAAPEFRRVNELFLRGLGLVYAVAFLSLGVQLRGLVGRDGILPASDFLSYVDERLPGAAHVLALPTLAWFSSSDAALVGLAVLGGVASLALAAGFVPAPAAAVAWISYLSLVHVGQAFLSFQWDALLLETGAIGILLSPWTLCARSGAWAAPPRAAFWLVRLLALKLMVSSGATKLTWHDATWHDLTALEYHYWTQPLPTALGIAAARLPDWMQRASCAGMFAIELAAPFGLFGPRRVRVAAFLAIVALQAGIAATGNYGFFNLLSVLLMCSYLDDESLPRALRGRAPAFSTPAEESPPSPGVAASQASRSRRVVALGYALAVAWLSVSAWGSIFGWSPDRSSLLGRSTAAAAPFYLSGDYGLFRVMTTSRPEIEIEVFENGVWRTVPFRFKPGDPARAPRWVAPHMPRLDWQMWFAGLEAEGIVRETAGRGAPDALPRWLWALAGKILHGSPEVASLFPREALGSASGAAPQAIRMTLWEYRLAEGAERASAVWHRERVAEILPPIRLSP